jgi:hypothetical protein
MALVSAAMCASLVLGLGAAGVITSWLAALLLGIVGPWRLGGERSLL